MKNAVVWLLCSISCFLCSVVSASILGYINIEPLSILAINYETLQTFKFFFAKILIIPTILVGILDLAEFVIALKKRVDTFNVDITFLLFSIICFIMAII